ncbi:hypothetical protein F7R91_05550 [Streptomyces luteolifulvus]|uniref:Uncharacterized protein n=1 Tax=Streptomyces luteolifulvus TaxID=2615112 RepID=A0A6H9V5R7_9ACTN|nr:hypothetical protein [Streptomyces luteolifulvus]KAB1149223.1 hypothetical protein F7R91_05550 [Streptomyces luteolifulvus]
MALTPQDPHSLGDLARVLVLGARISRREARGKSTKRLERRVERIREDAVKREEADAKKPLGKKKTK